MAPVKGACPLAATHAFIPVKLYDREKHMPESIKARVEAVLCDPGLDTKAKAAKLRQFEQDALARQRASTEGMEPHRPTEGEDLKIIERALISLGEKPADHGPASL